MDLKHKHSILLVDDEPSITKALRRLFRKDGYRIFTASSGKEGLDQLKKAEGPVSLIISDQRMPEMTGAQFLDKAKELCPDAFRFLLTGYSDMDAIVDAVNKGEIHRYLTKPWNDDDLLLQVRQSLEQYELVLENRRLVKLTNKQNKELKELNKNLEQKVDERTKKLKEANIKLEKGFMETIRLLSSMVSTLNPKLGEYMGHVAEFAREIGEEYGLDEEVLDQIEMAGMIHDIGLLGLPARILAKDVNQMDEKEFKIFSQHPVIASICIESIEKLQRVGEIILHHHEHIDGTGFPNGLKGDEIPLESRILSVVADYCKIIDTWPKEMKQIFARTREYLGEASKNLVVKEPEKMLGEVAKKAILLGTQKKYDKDVVLKMINKIDEPGPDSVTEKGKGAFLISLKDLKKGMVLRADLRMKDARLVLVKGTILKEDTIKTIQKLGGHGLIDSRIYVTY